MSETIGPNAQDRRVRIASEVVRAPGADAPHSQLLPVLRAYRCVRDQLDRRLLVPGDKLPSSRILSKRLGIARNTVMAAYEMLAADGYVIGRPGAGTFVARQMPPIADRPAVEDSLALLGAWAERLPKEPRLLPQRACRLDFRPGAPSAVGLHASGNLMGRALRRLSRWDLRDTAINDSAGYGHVRELLSNHLRRTHGIACRADDLVFTNGTQQAFDLVGRVFAGAGRIVAVEDPGYPAAVECFASLGFVIATVPVDCDGIVVSKIPRNASLIYTTPNRQFPLGYRLSLPRRKALLSHAARAGAYVIEDDYDGELHNPETRPPCLKTLDDCGRVVYLTSVSKYLIPQLRFACIVAPAEIRDVLVRAKWVTDRQVSILVQMIIDTLLRRGVLARIIRRADRDYAERHYALRMAVQTKLSRWLTVTDGAPGMHLTAIASADLDMEALVGAAASRDVGLYSLKPFCLTSPVNGLLFGLASLSLDEIAAGINEIQRLLLAGVARREACR